MSREVVVNFRRTDHHINVSEFPNVCGTCNLNIDPYVIVGAFIRPDHNDKKHLEVVFQCPNNECNSLLIGYYYKKDTTYIYDKTKPMELVDKSFGKEIEEVSQDFIDIYNQSYHAEQNELDLISGIGYRKALEFLIKDYLVYTNAEQEEDILKKPLGQCINMLDNSNIKEIARRASWLGNDEAHYTRKFADKDINDLKKLIEVTVYFIAMDVSAKKYLEEMK